MTLTGRSLMRVRNNKYQSTKRLPVDTTFDLLSYVLKLVTCSLQSVSSGSLLLSAAHLARMSGRHPIQEDRSPYQSKLGSFGRKQRSLSEAVVAIPEESRDPTDSFWTGVKLGSGAGQDAVSVASSTHFTVVNGFTRTRPGKEPRACCCSHSHQITVLVVSMTILFSACILAAICFVESKLTEYSRPFLARDVGIIIRKSGWLTYWTCYPQGLGDLWEYVWIFVVLTKSYV